MGEVGDSRGDKVNQVAAELEDQFAGSEDQFAGSEDQFAGMTDTTGLEVTNGGPSGDDPKPEYRRPVRVRKPVERLVMSFKGKKYGTTMVQVNAEMGGMCEGKCELHGVGTCKYGG